MEILKKTKDLLAGLVDVTEAGSKIARYTIEVANLDRKLGLAFKQIGEKVYSTHKEGFVDLGEDRDFQKVLQEIARIRSRMEVIHKEVDARRKKVHAEWDRAAKMVKKEAGKASRAVKNEAGKASRAVKKEAERAASAIKKAGRGIKESKSPAAGRGGGTAGLVKNAKKPAEKKASTSRKGPAKKASAKATAVKTPPSGKKTAATKTRTSARKTAGKTSAVKRVKKAGK
jgi:hypothetical protein